MSLSNKFIGIGRLTKDPELKRIGDGDKATSVLNFSIAINRKFNKNKDHPEADFVDCVAWGAKAELIAKYFAKGSKIGIEGRIETRVYTDKDGNNRRAWEVVVEDFDFIESKKDDAEGGSDKLPSESSSPNDGGGGEGDEDGDLPF